MSEVVQVIGDNLRKRVRDILKKCAGGQVKISGQISFDGESGNIKIKDYSDKMVIDVEFSSIHEEGSREVKHQCHMSFEITEVLSAGESGLIVTDSIGERVTFRLNKTPEKKT